MVRLFLGCLASHSLSAALLLMMLELRTFFYSASLFWALRVDGGYYESWLLASKADLPAVEACRLCVIAFGMSSATCQARYLSACPILRKDFCCLLTILSDIVNASSKADRGRTYAPLRILGPLLPFPSCGGICSAHIKTAGRVERYRAEATGLRHWRSKKRERGG